MLQVYFLPLHAPTLFWMIFALLSKSSLRLAQSFTTTHTHLKLLSPFSSALTTKLFSTMGGGTIIRKDEKIGLKQLFDDESSTYTYLLWDQNTKDAILVDPVDLQVDRDIKEAQDLELNLVYGGTFFAFMLSYCYFFFINKRSLTILFADTKTVNTHAHADHITGTGLLKQKIPGLQSVIAKSSGAVADIHIDPGDRIVFGNRFVSIRATPGHTAGCVSYVADDESFVLTGDALLIMGCGRTDFQGGSAETLYESVHSQLFTLPPTTIVYPAHDYKSQTSSTIGDEKENNPRLGKLKTKQEFIEIMANLNLDYPKKIDVAVPANLRDGVPDVE
jgi:sulfur dioxygenase